MGREKLLFKSEETRSAADVADFLQQLAEKIRERQVTLRRDTEEVVLNLPENVVLELKAEEEVKKGKTKRSLEIEIEWRENGGAGGKVDLL